MTQINVAAVVNPAGIRSGPRVLTCHPAHRCRDAPSGWDVPCAIHSPSPHHMRDWPMVWRADLRYMERECRHGVGHPDPDDLAFRRHAGRTPDEMHGCDGCCRPEIAVPAHDNGSGDWRGGPIG
jgi:hypothetical protein